MEILEQTTPDALIIPFKKEILALCEAFCKSGQSGGSAPYTASAISQAVKKLMLHETISPLTGEHDEWADVSYIMGETKLQNIRDSRVFKNGQEGQAYFLDAIVFNGDIGGSFTSNGGVKLDGKPISSRQFIKEFPFTPKVFYVDVVEQRWADETETTPDENGDWWTSTIKDKSQLDQVFEYYDRYDS